MVISKNTLKNWEGYSYSKDRWRINRSIHRKQLYQQWSCVCRLKVFHFISATKFGRTSSMFIMIEKLTCAEIIIIIVLWQPGTGQRFKKQNETNLWSYWFLEKMQLGFSWHESTINHKTVKITFFTQRGHTQTRKTSEETINQDNASSYVIRFPFILQSMLSPSQ